MAWQPSASGLSPLSATGARSAAPLGVTLPFHFERFTRPAGRDRSAPQLQQVPPAINASWSPHRGQCRRFIAARLTREGGGSDDGLELALRGAAGISFGVRLIMNFA
jgi:hypothetical protein